MLKVSYFRTDITSPCGDVSAEVRHFHFMTSSDLQESNLQEFPN